jgi:hypothetical protein
MLKAIQDLLDRVAERCLAVTGGMLSSTLESLHVAHLADQQKRLEELARGFDADGLPDIAASIRDRARNLTVNGAAAQTTVLLQLATSSPALNGNSGQSHSSSPGSVEVSTRRLRGRAKRNSAPATLAEGQALAAAAGDAFFPLDSGKSHPQAEDSLG